MWTSVRWTQHTAILCMVASLVPSAALGQTPAKKPPVGPAAPQSMHYPILLLASGDAPSWSLRIGQKGPERLDRSGYPPIPLEPAGVTREGTTDAWTYRAKDAATGADVSVHLVRQDCSVGLSDTKYTFRAVAEHAQIGTLEGCARVAAELFPKTTATGEEKDDEDDDKAKPPAPTITNFKLPAAVAYINLAGNVVLKRGRMTRVVAQTARDLAISHDGKKLLFVRGEEAGRTINEYDFDTGRIRELIRGDVRSPSWSPDDSLIAFLKFEDLRWQLWTFPASDALKASVLDRANFDSIDGWVDPHTILASDSQNLIWVTDVGFRAQTLSLKEICGAEFDPESAMTIRLHPANPDLLLLSALFVHPPPDVPLKPGGRAAAGFFLYELRSKRRVRLPIPALSVSNGEWSRDGLQIYFTALSPGQKPATYRLFWDATGLQKYLPGSNLVIGQ